MAQFTKVNGDFLPVINYDSFSYTNSGLNAVEANVAVQPQGPKLDFFTVTATGALSGANVASIIQAVEQLATVHIYEYVNDTNDSVALAIYPVGAWNTTTLNANVAAAGISGTTTTAVASFNN
jgi:hypothetical protein